MNRKKFNKLSIVGQFHNAPKLFGDKAEYPFYSDLQIQKIKEQTAQRVFGLINNKEVLTLSEGQHLIKVINAALNVQINDEEKNNYEEIQKLEACKKRIKSYLGGVLEDIQKYAGTIRECDEATKTKNAEIIEQIDKKRTSAHNRLMSDLNTLNRSLLWWFGNYEINSEELPADLKQMYEKQEEKYISDEIERIDIGQNGICPPELDVHNRTQITLWALDIYKDIAKIRKKLS